MAIAKSVVLHGNDIGIWVCDAGAVIIGHALLMESVCPNFPRHADVEFRQPQNDKRQHFQDNHPLSLYYGEYGLARTEKCYLHLFGIGEAAARTFIEECDLVDLQFPVRMAGIILVVAKRTIDLGRIPVLELDWARQQNLPFVIAATGYSAAGFSEHQFCRGLGLEPGVPIITGPAIDMDRRPGFDPVYAGQVLGAIGECVGC